MNTCITFYLFIFVDFFFIYDLIAKKIFNDIIKKTYKYFIFAFTSSLEMIFKGTWTYHSS